MKYASVCSGVEAATLAWEYLGWEPAWFSEIEPFPCAVLKERFPNVPNLGDMTKIKVENLENGDQRFTNGDGTVVDVCGGVDLLVGGTPCQGFSVAGKQGGLQDDRSVLCLTFCQLLADMHPRWFVWENVPGVFSTGGGEDFKAFLRKVNEVGYCCAWRVLDAQYTRVDGYPRAVPQRRRRVFVIGHLGDEWQYPAEVLFEPQGVFGNNPPGRVKGKGFTADAERSVGTASTVRMRAGCDGGGKGALVSHERSLTLAAAGNDQAVFVCNNAKNENYGLDLYNQSVTGSVSMPVTAAASDVHHIPSVMQTLNCMHDQQAVMCLNDQGGSVMQIEQNGNAGTLRANTHGNEQIVCIHGAETPIYNSEHANPVTCNHAGLENVVCYENHANDSRITESNDVSPLISSRAGTGGGNLPLAQECYVKTARPKYAGDCEKYEDTGVAPTVNTFDQGDKRANELVVTLEVFAIDSTASNSMKSSNPNSGFHREEIAKTLDTTDPNPTKNQGGNVIVSSINCQGGQNININKEITDTLTAATNSSGNNLLGVCEFVAISENIVGMDGYNSTLTGDVSSTIGVNAGMSTGRNGVVSAVAFEPGIAKREGGDSRFVEECSGTLRSNAGDNQTAVATNATVRRLLPVECERLMGFPDNWTRIPWKGKPEEDCPDSPRYKACGNSMCVNVMRWIGMRIENIERKTKGVEK